MTDAETVYGSANSLYIASQRWVSPNVDQGEIPEQVTTAIHRFDASQSGVTTYRSTGAVSGMLLSSYSLSEAGAGRLRVASTDQPTWFNGGQQEESQSFMTILGESGGRARTLGRVGGLGKGERIYAVRYVGDTAFIVTFRQTDPLYTVDLSDPAAPKVLGELKIQGFSAYLTRSPRTCCWASARTRPPRGGGPGPSSRSSTSGTCATSSGSPRGASAPRRPRRWSSTRMRSSWPKTKLAVVPVNSYGQDESSSFFGAFGFHIGPERGIQDAGTTKHPSSSYGNGIDRSLVARGRLFTVSAAGIRGSDLDDLHDLTFTAFPGAPSNDQPVKPQPATGGPTAMP